MLEGDYMYNFDFLKNEELIEIFEDVWIVQGKNEKCTTIALTNQRLLFLDYDKFDSRENLRVGRGVEYARFKEVYYSIDLMFFAFGLKIFFNTMLPHESVKKLFWVASI